MADVTQHESAVPRWAIRLLYRLGGLERGRVYKLILITAGEEPSWALEEVSKLENWREQPAG